MFLKEFRGHGPYGNTVFLAIVHIFVGCFTVKIDAVAFLQDILSAAQMDGQFAFQHISAFFPFMLYKGIGFIGKLEIR